MSDWGGPARPTNEFAVAMGFAGAKEMPDEAWALWKRIEADEALTGADWRRTLLAAEVVFASDVVGSGVEWPTTTGFPDDESIVVLRKLQRKLLKVYTNAQL